MVCNVIKIGNEKIKIVRKSWSKLFKNMSKNGDDKLIIDDGIDLDLKDKNEKNSN